MQSGKNLWLKRGQMSNREEIKKEKENSSIVLLGTGEAGKATFFNQMQILYGNKTGYFGLNQRVFFRKRLHKQIWNDIETLVHMISRGPGFATRNATDASFSFKSILSPNRRHQIPRFEEFRITPEIAGWMNTIWNDPSVKNAWINRGALGLQLQDTLPFFMSQIEFIGQENYLPSIDHILLTRLRTSGIKSSVFQIHDMRVEILLVGGQRSERRKWLSVLDRATSLLFFAAASEYDQFLFEASDVNRQTESINLFRRTMSYGIFQNIPCILFLNKEDVLKEKLATVPFKVSGAPSNNRNEDFLGPNLDLTKTYDIHSTDLADPFYQHLLSVKNYLIQKYATGYTEKVFPHFITVIHTKNVKNFVDSYKDTVLRSFLHLYQEQADISL